MNCHTDNNQDTNQEAAPTEPCEFSLSEKSPLVTTFTKYSGENELLSSGKELKRRLEYRHAFVFIVGILIGSGIFLSPSMVAKESNNMGTAIIIWIISGVPCLLGALCFCELACMYKKSGGLYVFIYEAYGGVVAFFSIWANLTVIRPIGIAVPALVIGEHIVQPFYDTRSIEGIWLTKSIAILSLFIPTVINCFSVSFAGKTQVLFTTIQTLTILFLVVLGIWQASIGHTKNYEAMFNGNRSFDFGSFGLAFYNALWSYEGWGGITIVCEEIKNVKTNLWLSIITGIPFVVFCYVLVNLALMSVLSHLEIAATPTVATVFVQRILGRKVAMIIPFAVALSSFGSNSASLFCFSRIFLSAAREGHLPYALCFIHKNKRTPVISLITIFVLTTIWIMPGGDILQNLLTYYSFALWCQYFLAISSVIVMRIRRPDMERPYKVWLINPILICLLALFLIVIPFVKRPVESSICFLILLSALPIYYIFIYKHENLPLCLTKGTNCFNKFLIAKLNLAPCIFVNNSLEVESTESTESKI